MVLAAEQSQNADAGRHHHRDFAQRVEPSEVDQDDVDDVATVRERNAIVGKECAEPAVEACPEVRAEAAMRLRRRR